MRRLLQTSAGVALALVAMAFKPVVYREPVVMPDPSADNADDCSYYLNFKKDGEQTVCWASGPYCIVCPAKT